MKIETVEATAHRNYVITLTALYDRENTNKRCSIDVDIFSYFSNKNIWKYYLRLYKIMRNELYMTDRSLIDIDELFKKFEMELRKKKLKKIC